MPTEYPKGNIRHPVAFSSKLRGYEQKLDIKAKLFRTERINPASTDKPALEVSPEDALMELIVSPTNLRRAWYQVSSNRGVPGPAGSKADGYPIRKTLSFLSAKGCGIDHDETQRTSWAIRMQEADQVGFVCHATL
ncbi:hypothetical protein SH449x_004555 [Pirellulaceae bacterium SH449]